MPQVPPPLMWLPGCLPIVLCMMTSAGSILRAGGLALHVSPCACLWALRRCWQLRRPAALELSGLLHTPLVLRMLPCRTASTARASQEAVKQTPGELLPDVSSCNSPDVVSLQIDVQIDDTQTSRG